LYCTLDLGGSFHSFGSSISRLIFGASLVDVDRGLGLQGRNWENFNLNTIYVNLAYNNIFANFAYTQVLERDSTRETKGNFTLWPSKLRGHAQNMVKSPKKWAH